MIIVDTSVSIDYVKGVNNSASLPMPENIPRTSFVQSFTELAGYAVIQFFVA